MLPVVLVELREACLMELGLAMAAGTSIPRVEPADQGLGVDGLVGDASATEAVGASIREWSTRAAFRDAAVIRTPRICACLRVGERDVLIEYEGGQRGEHCWSDMW